MIVCQVEKLCVPPDEEQGAGEVDPGAALGQSEGASSIYCKSAGNFFQKDILKCCIFCPTPGTMGEKGAEKSEFYVPGVGTISGQAKMPE